MLHTLLNAPLSGSQKLSSSVQSMAHSTSLAKDTSADLCEQTHAATHDSYSMTVKHVFRARRDHEEAAFKGDAVGNRMLLWHGSRLTNWVGILSQGLRIAPPEAPATGYMFGKGVPLPNTPRCPARNASTPG